MTNWYSSWSLCPHINIFSHQIVKYITIRHGIWRFWSWAKLQRVDSFCEMKTRGSLAAIETRSSLLKSDRTTSIGANREDMMARNTALVFENVSLRQALLKRNRELAELRIKILRRKSISPLMVAPVPPNFRKSDKSTQTNALEEGTPTRSASKCDVSPIRSPSPTSLLTPLSSKMLHVRLSPPPNTTVIRKSPMPQRRESRAVKQALMDSLHSLQSNWMQI